MRTTLPRLVAAFAAVAFPLVTAASAQTITFSLDGAQEVPPVASPGVGVCTVTLNAATGAVTVAGTYQGLAGDATAAHIHGPGAPGTSAGIVLGLGVSGGTDGTVAGGGTLTPAQVAELQAGLYYVNVHSTAFGGGEIRGQIAGGGNVVAYGGNPGWTLSLIAGAPVVGAVATLGIDHPAGLQPPGSLSVVGISTAPDLFYELFGSGTPLPFGELLISLVPLATVAGAPWPGPGTPAPIAIAVPLQPSAIGLTVFAQGALVNPSDVGPKVGLTNGLMITIG